MRGVLSSSRNLWLTVSDRCPWCLVTSSSLYLHLSRDSWIWANKQLAWNQSLQNLLPLVWCQCQWFAWWRVPFLTPIQRLALLCHSNPIDCLKPFHKPNQVFFLLQLRIHSDFLKWIDRQGWLWKGFSHYLLSLALYHLPIWLALFPTVDRTSIFRPTVNAKNANASVWKLTGLRMRFWIPRRMTTHQCKLFHHRFLVSQRLTRRVSTTRYKLA